VPERDGYIAGVPCWVDTSQPDPDAAAAFYAGLFGWEFEDAMPAGSEGRYLIGRLRGGDVAAVSSQPQGAPPQATWNTYIWVEDADEAAAKAREAGGSIVSESVDVAAAGRMAVLADPEGAVFSVWQAREHKGAGVVNEHGALNFNILKTGDPEIAKRFYGAVFGWTTLDLGSGQFWAMSAYGDYLEARTPGTRAQAAEFGAAGFEEVVAAIAPLSGDARASWNVTFGTEDADATAAKAMELGGTVVVPPVDAPYSRFTVLRDPQGATFTASAFVPENKDIGRAA
jgi:predicted enzyme related to lactoylglutathione lyase